MHAVDTLVVAKPDRRAPVAIQPALPLTPLILIFVAIFACTVWSQAAYVIVDPAKFVYFPPFEAGRNANATDHLGGEHFNIARSLARGQGFSSPFHESTGPTAWMPPLLPSVYAALPSGKDAVVVAVLMQVAALADRRRPTSERRRPPGGWIAALLFLLGMIWDFHAWFQFTHDYGLILLVVDMLVVGMIFGHRSTNYKSAAAWGFAGGVCALVSPIVGLVWLALSSIASLRPRSVAAFSVAVLVAAAMLVPWTVRNYFAFGRFIPIKSNASYELSSRNVCRPTACCNRPFSKHIPTRRMVPRGANMSPGGRWLFSITRRIVFGAA